MDNGAIKVHQDAFGLVMGIEPGRQQVRGGLYMRWYGCGWSARLATAATRVQFPWLPARLAAVTASWTCWRAAVVGSVKKTA